MDFDKNKIMQLDKEEKRNLAFDLLDSIDEEFMNEPIADWKQKLIKERLGDDAKNPDDIIAWSELKKKYFRV